jgi:hypothetical protein
MNKLYIYEAGSLTKLSQINKFNMATEWRDKLDKWAIDNSILTFNPAKTFMQEQAHFISGGMAVKQNDLYLDKTNIMVVQMDYIDYSPGTIYELVTYKHQYPWKPVIAFSLDENNLYNKSPHIDSCITSYCDSIDEVINLLSLMFSQSLK